MNQISKNPIYDLHEQRRLGNIKTSGMSLTVIRKSTDIQKKKKLVTNQEDIEL